MKRDLVKEKDIFKLMVDIYCKGHKHGKITCKDCQSIIDYGMKRIDNCPFGEEKTFCSQCKVHCFKDEMRIKVKKVMRYSGPRMVFYHPIMALKHLLRRNK